MSGSVIGALIFGVVLLIVGFAHPIGPGLMLAAETPFDPIPFYLFGVVGNLVTYVPILIFLIKVNPAYWGQAFLGTRIQQYIALMILALLVSHMMTIVDRGVGQILEWLRKVTLFLLLAVFAHAMREKYMSLLVKVMVGSMAVLTVLAMFDFYLGIQVLPVKSGIMEGAALETEFEAHLATDWRFTAPGLPVNRYANYLLLPIFLGVGWFMYVRNPIQRAIAITCTGILILAIFFTVTRASILGMVVGMLIMFPLALRFSIGQVIGVVVVGAIFGALGYYALSLTAADEVLSARFDPAHVVHSTGGRWERVVAAFRIWAEHPFLGVGWSSFKFYSGEHIGAGGKGSHNGFTNVLAEAGLLGFIPLMIVVVAVLRRSLARVGHLSAEYEFWRPYFFCALIAQLITDVFNDYLWERYLYVTFAFAVVLEQAYHGARAKEARARLEAIRGIGTSSPPSPDPVAARVRLT